METCEVHQREPSAQQDPELGQVAPMGPALAVVSQEPTVARTSGQKESYSSCSRGGIGIVCT